MTPALRKADHPNLTRHRATNPIAGNFADAVASQLLRCTLDFRNGSLADIASLPDNVRSTPESGHCRVFIRVDL
jgi:hypothetical protein